METAPLSPGQIARRAVRSILYQGVGQYLSLAIGIVKGMLLARLIMPNTFGVVALAISYTSFFNVFKMQVREGVTRDTAGDKTRLFTLYAIEVISALPGFVIAGILYLVLPAMVSEQHWIAIAAILTIRLITALASVPTYILERDIRYDVLARLTLLGTILSLLVSVPVAYFGYHLAALLLDQAALIIVTAIGVWLASRWRVQFKWDADIARDSLRFGSVLWMGGLFGKITFEFDDWLIGTFQGDTALGFYSKAYSLAKMPMDIVGGILASVALGIYGQSNAAGRDTLARAYTLMTWMLARLIGVSSAVMLAAAEEITLILYGPNWLPLVPLLRLMFLYVLARPFWQNDAQLLISIGKENAHRWLLGLQALLLLIMAPPAVLNWGAAGASVAVSIMMIIGAAATGIYTAKQLSVNTIPLYALPALLCLILSPGLYLLGNTLSLAAIPALLIKGTLAVVLFGGAVFLFERKRVFEALQLARSNFSDKTDEEAQTG